MRIAYFTESLYPNVDGVSRTLARLFSSLEQRGDEFLIFSPFMPDESVSWSSRVHPLRYIRFPLYPDYRVSLPFIGRGIADALADFDPELVHVVSPTPMAVRAQRWARQNGVAVVASFHTHFVSYFRYYRVGWLESGGWAALRRFYARCERVYAPSNSIAGELRDQGIENVELWSRGIDLERFSPSFRDPELRSRTGASESVPMLLLVSRLVREKDLEDLVAVDRILKDRSVSFRLALVGDGPMRGELEKLLPDAHFAGHQEGESLARWYASADVFIFPSTTETLGNVVLESLASGVPAVVVNRGGPQDLISHGENGFVARANDVQDIADRVEVLLRDREMRERMGDAARRLAGNRDWDAINGRLIESYRALLRARGRSADG